jgi:hypothetical protein
MIYRSKFVTNSSSSSYIGWGYRLTKEDLHCLSEDQRDALYDTYSWGNEESPHFIHDENEPALVILIARYSDEDFVQFVEDNQLKKIEWNTSLLATLRKYNITPSTSPGWVFSYSYG